MSTKRKRRRKPSAALLREWAENETLRATKSSNGATGMHTEGFREPNPKRFTKHVSKPYTGIQIVESFTSPHTNTTK